MTLNAVISNEAFTTIGADRKGDWLIMCDHASNAVPAWVNNGDLGIASQDMDRHIAYDVGAAGVTRRLAEALDAPAVLANFSRLVIDPNRGEDDPTLIMQLYDGTLIPANRRVSQRMHDDRLHRLYRPYHTEIDRLLAGRTAIYVAVHSFTPKLSGRPLRPWHVTVLAADDTRFSDPLLARLRQEADICTAENEPYTGKLAGDSIDRHALRSGIPNALIEIRNDLIATEADQKDWAERLAVLLQDARKAMI